MRRCSVYILSLVLLTTSVVAGATPRQKSKQRVVAIVGATIVDLNGKPGVTDSVVVIEGDRIKAAGAAGKVKVPRGAEVIEARGKFLLPGLIDTHTHGEYDGRGSWMLSRFLKHGVTTVLDTGSTVAIYELKRRINSGELAGPRMLVSGPLLTGEPVTFPMSQAVKSADEAVRAVDERAAAGADFVKFHAQFNPAFIQAATDEARKKNLRIIAHTGRTNALEAVRAGANIITHLVGVPDAAVADPERVRAAHAAGFIAGWISSSLAWGQADQAKLEEFLREMIARKVALSPTLNIHQSVAFSQDPLPYRDEALATNPPAETIKQWQALASQPGDRTPFKKVWPLMQQFVKRFHDAGGLLIVGTDTAAAFQPPGLSLHEEMRLMVEAGVPVAGALRAATINAARALGIEREAGTIEPGKIADIVVLDADPLADIRNTRKIHRVIRAGSVYDWQKAADR